MCYFGTTDSLFGFLVISPMGLKSRVGCLICIVEVNVLYVP